MTELSQANELSPWGTVWMSTQLQRPQDDSLPLSMDIDSTCNRRCQSPEFCYSNFYTCACIKHV
jgi:hypothetical protein